MLCHLPLVLPLAGLLLFFVLPFPVALAVYLPFAALSAVFAVKVIEAMLQPASTGSEGMRGAQGVVMTVHGTRGVVQVRGEIWSFLAREPLTPGARVAIVEIKGLTALVRPVPR